MEQWQRQFIRCLFHYSPSRLRIDEAFRIKNPHIPRFLYKYREFSEPHLDALRRGVLFMSSPDRFDDPRDTTIFFHPSHCLVEDLPVEEVIERVKIRDRDRQAGKNRRWKILKNPIRYDDKMRQVMAEILKDAPDDIREALTASHSSWFEGFAKDLRNNINAFLRSGDSVLSLSTDPASILMWSRYSAGHRGFCIEYDFDTLSPDDKRRRMCFPVLYRKKATNATRYMANIGASDFNCLFGQYLCLLKSADWSYEKEWRIVITIGPDYANREIPMPRPSAIIAGSAAKDSDIETVKAFCDSSKIALKRAVQSHNSYEITICE